MGSTSPTLQLYQRYLLNHKRREIRVLVVQDGGEHDTIQCSIERTSLDDAPEYNALSYAWGDNTRSCSIIVDGIFVPVAKSAEMALRSLRACEADSLLLPHGRLLRSSDGRLNPIWIDAICINQDDAEERADQVQLMRAIYSLATNVVVWLGEGNPRTDDAFDLMRQQASRGDLSLRRQYPSQSHATLPPTPELLMLETVIKQDICKRAWWTRLWVRQEFLLARISPFMMCGNKGISWDWFLFYFMRLPRSWTHPDAASKHITEESSGTVVDKNWIGIHPISLHHLREDLKRRGIFPIDHALRYLIRNALATDPRDYIYGLLGLVDEQVTSQINIDYSVDCMDLYKQIARLLWRDHPNTMLAELLPAFRFHGERNGFPSWVPDFRQAKLRGWQDQKTLQGSTSWRELDYACFNEPNNQLLLRGIFIDRIQATHQSTMSVLDDHGLAQKVKYYEDIVAEAQQRPVPAHHRFRRLATMKNSETPMRTLTRSRVLQLEDDEKFHPQYTDEEIWYAFLGRRPLTHDAEGRDPPESEQMCLRLRRMLAAKLDDRCVFTSEIGFGGVGVSGIETGDAIVLVFGASGPLVLRPYNGFYRLIGCAYVSGLMDVTTLEQVCSKDCLKEQEFDIR